MPLCILLDFGFVRGLKSDYIVFEELTRLTGNAEQNEEILSPLGCP